MEQCKCICPTCGNSHNNQHRAIIVIGIAAYDIPSTTFNRNNIELVIPKESIEIKPRPILVIPEIMVASLPYEEPRKPRNSRTNKRKFNGF